MNRLGSYSAAIEDVVVLLRSGRAGMALTVLESLTGLVDGELMAAMAAGHVMGRRGEPLPGGRKARRPRTRKRHEWLRERIANPALRDRAKQLLRLDDRLLDAIAEGGVGLSSSSWRKLRRELGG